AHSPAAGAGRRQRLPGAGPGRVRERPGGGRALTGPARREAPGGQRRAPWQEVAAVSDVWGQRLKAMERHPWLGAGLVAAGIAAAALVTYLTGGTVSVFPHLFYIPVLKGGFFYGPSGEIGRAHV